MRSFFQHPRVRLARTIFRWIRITVWFIIFLIVAAVAYLHLIGLPDFLKRPLLADLNHHGIEARFTNMRLGWGPSVIVDNAAFRRAHEPLSARLSAGETELAVDWHSLVHKRIQLNSLQVGGAQLKVPFSETNGDVLSLDQVRLGLTFSSNDYVRLNDCQGRFRGIQIQLNGDVHNYNKFRDWKFPSWHLAGKTNQPIRFRLREVAQTLEKIHFTKNPILNLTVTADGADTNSLRAELNFTTRGAQTPWGDASGLQVMIACAHIFDPGPNPFLQMRCVATNMATRWASGRDVSVVSTFYRGTNSTIEGVLNMGAARIRAQVGTNRVQSAALSWDGSVFLTASNLAPLSLNGTLQANDPRTPWGSVHRISLKTHAARLEHPPSTDVSWGPWAKIGPYTFDWQTELQDVVSPKLRFDRVVSSGHWRAPQVSVENFEAKLYGGQMSAEALLDVSTREFHCSGNSDFDPHQVSPVLTPGVQRWMTQYDWTIPPKVHAQLRLVLPPWTNRPPEWRTNMRSSLEIAGHFTVGPASFRKVPVTSAESHFYYSNRVWNVPGLHAVRPDGEVSLDYTGSDATHDFHFRVDSRLDPKDCIPLLPPLRRKVLDDLGFPTSPKIHAEVWGRWHANERLGFFAEVAATNFIARGETVDSLNARVDFTNMTLRVHDLRLLKDKGELSTPSASADFLAKKVVLTNVTSTLDANILPRILGARTPKFLTVIHFDKPPSVTVSGSFNYHDPLATDLHFYIRGQQFHWSNLLANRIEGAVNWEGRTVSITNVEASLYNTGTLVGWILFDYVPKHGSDFRTHIVVTDIDLSAVVKGFSEKTNHIEGMLDGDLVLDGPRTTERENWQGRGTIHVHDARLWDIKLFGLLSPILNAISPGAGDSRAREANATFVITNGGVSTDDLIIRSTPFRLLYWGTVDMNRSINARVEADLVRDTPLFGPLLSLVLSPLSKLFEYQLSGTLHNPVMQPVYVPKFIMLMLRPFHTLKTLSNSPSTTPATPPLTVPKNGK